MGDVGQGGGRARTPDNEMERDDLESRGWHGEHEGASEEVVQGYKRAWEGRDTQDTSKGPDQGTTPAEEGAVEKMGAMESPAHSSGISRGEEKIKEEGKEPGRYDAGTKGIATERPVGKSTMRDATALDPQEPIDEESPTIIPGEGGR
jgi:hypothetical protein